MICFNLIIIKNSTKKRDYGQFRLKITKKSYKKRKKGKIIFF